MDVVLIAGAVCALQCSDEEVEVLLREVSGDAAFDEQLVLHRKLIRQAFCVEPLLNNGSPCVSEDAFVFLSNGRDAALLRRRVEQLQQRLAVACVVPSPSCGGPSVRRYGHGKSTPPRAATLLTTDVNVRSQCLAVSPSHTAAALLGVAEHSFRIVQALHARCSCLTPPPPPPSSLQHQQEQQLQLQRNDGDGDGYGDCDGGGTSDTVAGAPSGAGFMAMPSRRSTASVTTRRSISAAAASCDGDATAPAPAARASGDVAAIDVRKRSRVVPASLPGQTSCDAGARGPGGAAATLVSVDRARKSVVGDGLACVPFASTASNASVPPVGATTATAAGAAIAVATATSAGSIVSATDGGGVVASSSSTSRRSVEQHKGAPRRSRASASAATTTHRGKQGGAGSQWAPQREPCMWLTTLTPSCGTAAALHHLLACPAPSPLPGVDALGRVLDDKERTHALRLYTAATASTSSSTTLQHLHSTESTLVALP
jgi:hypothetical protein